MIVFISSFPQAFNSLRCESSVTQNVVAHIVAGFRNSGLDVFPAIGTIQDTLSATVSELSLQARSDIPDTFGRLDPLPRQSVS
jgi:hypothetical protein